MLSLSMYVYRDCIFCHHFHIRNYFVIQLLLKQILVNLLHVARTLNADKSMAKLYVLACLDILVHLRLVGQNVSQVANVLKMKLATTKNVLILVQVHVASTPDVK